MNLTDVPTDDLIHEIMNRTETCVIGFTRYIDPSDPAIYINHQCKAGWLTGVGLCECIKRDLLKRNLTPEV